MREWLLHAQMGGAGVSATPETNERYLLPANRCPQPASYEQPVPVFAGGGQLL